VDQLKEEDLKMSSSMDISANGGYSEGQPSSTPPLVVHAQSSINISSNNVPELLLPVATTALEVFDESETIIKAADKAGYNVRRHLDALTFAKEIVERYKQRGNVLPKEWTCTSSDPAREQEYKDAGKLRKWKQALKGTYRGNICAKEIREYLDEHMPAWRVDRKVKFRTPMQFAFEIIERYNSRGGVLPRFVKDRSDPAKVQEFKDATKLKGWKQGLKGTRKEKCSDEIRDLLDKHMPMWRAGGDSSPSTTHEGYRLMKPMDKARDIVQRYRARGNMLPREWSDCRGDAGREQEYKDAGKLRKWRQALKGVKTISSICPDEVRDFLDREMPNWRAETKKTKKKLKLSENEHMLAEHTSTGLGSISGLSSQDLMMVNTAHDSHTHSHNLGLGLSDAGGFKRSRQQFEMENPKEESMHRLGVESLDV